MRYRILLLYVFASLLGMPVLVHYNRSQVACANIPDSSLCALAYPTPAWVRPMGWASVVVLAYATFLLVNAMAARRHEKEMLDAVGVHVREEDLPLEE